MKKIQYASHNTMSYLPIDQWYLRPFGFMARCQSTPLREQVLEHDVHVFDLRIRYKKGDYTTPYFYHGGMRFKGSIYTALDTIAESSFSGVPYVRVVLELPYKTRDYRFQTAAFAALCRECEERYKSIRFFGGVRKYDWYQIYKFRDSTPLNANKEGSVTIKRPEPLLIDAYSSMQWKGVLAWFPYLYAKIMNKRNRRKYAKEIKKGSTLMLDFI